MPPDIPEKRVSSPAVERNGAELYHPTTRVENKPLPDDFAVCDECGAEMTIGAYLRRHGECIDCEAERWIREEANPILEFGPDPEEDGDA